MAYFYDSLGRRVARLDNGVLSTKWRYDDPLKGLGRLADVKSFGGATKTYTYSPSNPEEVASTSVGGGPATTYGYDGNGNATSIAGPGGLSEALSYDAQSRLVQVTLGSPHRHHRDSVQRLRAARELQRDARRSRWAEPGRDVPVPG